MVRSGLRGNRPDGAVWICDWYNLIIQHNPTPNVRSSGLDARNGKGNAYESPIRDSQHGRIYRIYPRGSLNDVVPDLDPAKPQTLIAGLNHPNLLWRLHAQRLIVESGDKSLAASLKSAVSAGNHSSVHAVYALAGLGELDSATVNIAFNSNDRAMKRAAIVVASPQQLKDTALVDGTLKITDDRELADTLVSLSRLPEDAAFGKVLFNLITQEESRITEDVSLKDAWQISANLHAASVTAAAEAAGYTGEAPAEKRVMPNVLPNPSFEEVAEGKPVSWTEIRAYGDGTSPQLSSTTNGRSGTSALALSSSKTVDGGAIITVRVKPDTIYRLSGWIKAVDLKVVGEGLGGMFLVESGERSGSVKGTTDWTEISTLINTGDRTRLLIHCLIGAFGGATGTLYYDDLSLIEIPGASGAKGMLAALAAKAGGNPAAVGPDRKFKVDPAVHKRGAEVYNLTCIACHQPTGAGLEGAFPPLDGSDWATGEPTVPIRIVIGGLQGPVKVSGHDFNAVMPPHVDLDDQKIADVLTYVRQSWSNDAASVTPAQVKEIRDQYKDRVTPWTAAELGR